MCSRVISLYTISGNRWDFCKIICLTVQYSIDFYQLSLTLLIQHQWIKVTTAEFHFILYLRLFLGINHLRTYSCMRPLCYFAFTSHFRIFPCPRADILLPADFVLFNVLVDNLLMKSIHLDNIYVVSLLLNELVFYL